jgi:acetolactate synthase-1/2/3 large subunit
MLKDVSDVLAGPRVEVAEPAPSEQAMEQLTALMRNAKKPFLVLGGSRWSAKAVRDVHTFAEKWGLPVGCSFRRQQLFDHLHANYAGDVGLGINPRLRQRIQESDLIILLGARFSENPSQGFNLLSIPKAAQKLVQIHSGAEEIGRIYTPDVSVVATPETFLSAVLKLTLTQPFDEAINAHDDYLNWTDTLPQTPGKAEMGPIMAHIRETLPEAIVTNGAGNYAIWVHRFWRFRSFGSQLAPTSGSMGYGLPAAIAGKLRCPDKTVLCFAGDGCFQMTMQEFGTAVQVGANIIVLLVDNGVYGTIRMHQERDYPNRISATGISNPDFAAIARAYGAHAETINETAEFEGALTRAIESEKPALIHIKTDPEASTPVATLSKIRGTS